MSQDSKPKVSLIPPFSVATWQKIIVFTILSYLCGLIVT